jgi:ABC-type polysaccharide/polyol phosphate transport system ATPase subunit
VQDDEEYSRMCGVFGPSQSLGLQNAHHAVSFDVERGGFFRIVERNESGKGMLVKILIGIYPPTSGEVSVRGKLGPFIELGVGIHREGSGRENAHVDWALLVCDAGSHRLLAGHLPPVRYPSCGRSLRGGRCCFQTEMQSLL